MLKGQRNILPGGRASDCSPGVGVLVRPPVGSITAWPAASLLDALSVSEALRRNRARLEELRTSISRPRYPVPRAFLEGPASRGAAPAHT